MEEISPDLMRFRRCRDLHGSPVSLTLGRRNGKPAVFLPPVFEAPDPPPEPQDLSDQSKLFVNLNPIERETWRKLLQARSVASIAKEEGVSRAAIYARMQGNSRGQGGMIAKSFWVQLWWRLRKQLLNDNHD